MRYAQIRSLDISNGEGVGVALYTQGCRFHCKNCFNSELWEYNKGKEWNSEIEDYLVSLLSRDYIDRISFLGGEPLSDENLEDLDNLLNRIRKECPSKKIWVYTGYTYEIIKDRLSYILKNIDVLVDGLYIDELRDLKLEFRGSSNQRVIDIQSTIKCNEVITLY